MRSVAAELDGKGWERCCGVFFFFDAALAAAGRFRLVQQVENVRMQGAFSAARMQWPRCLPSAWEGTGPFTAERVVDACFNE